MRKIGETVIHSLSGVRGVIDATARHPDDTQIARVNDHWFFARDTKVSGK